MDTLIRARGALRWLTLLCALVFLLSVVPAAAGAPASIKVLVDGQELAFDAPPRITDDRTLVPMRAIFEALGAGVGWDDATRTVTATREDTTVTLTIGSARARLDGHVYALDVAAQIFEGRTFVPLRFVGEALGAAVHWDGATRTIAIDARPPAADPAEPPEDITDLSVSVAIDPEFIPAGGGQTVTITLAVADQRGNPVENARLGLFSERPGPQPWAAELTTDAAGRATATYVTRAEDDDHMLVFAAGGGVDDVQVDANFTVTASDRAARLGGRFLDPATGEPLANRKINLTNVDLDRYMGFVLSDANGYYSAVVPTGDYWVQYWFDEDLGDNDQIYFHVTEPGASYTLDYDKGLLKGVVVGGPREGNLYAVSSAFTMRDFWNRRDAFTYIADLAPDGSFWLRLKPETYELWLMGGQYMEPFLSGVVIEGGEEKDLGVIHVGN